MLATLGTMLLAGRWLDLYLHVEPPVAGPRPVFGLAEIGPLLLLVGVAILVFWRSFRQRSPVPTADPLLQESLAYHS